MIPEYSIKIREITTVARATKKFIFTKPLNWNFKTGQFISIKFTEKDWRAYSIASNPDDKFLELIVRIIPNGVGSTILDKAKIDDDFIFRGAFGHFFLTENQTEELNFFATGTGIAPLKSMIKTENKKPNPRAMNLFYGGRNEEDIAYLNELNEWSENLQIFLGFSREILNKKNIQELKNCTIKKSRITDFLDKNNFEKNASFYICGNKEMVLSIREKLEDLNIEKSQIFQERFN